MLRVADWGTLLFMSAAFALILTTHLHDGAVPHDSGTLAHAAERVLQGQLPHRDFDDPYTGGLSMLNAASFAVGGVTVLSGRWVLLGFSVVTFAVLYRLFRRTAPIWASALLTAAAFSWSVPNYFEPMPSWYNLFFGIYTMSALAKYAETDRRRWLVAAGFFTGLSFLVKVIGVYFAAVAALFVIYLEQRRSEQTDPAGVRRPLCTGIVYAGLLLFAVGVSAVVGGTGGWADWITFTAPSFALAGYLAFNEHRLRFHNAAGRLRRLLQSGGLFAAGAVVPVALFLVPYVVVGGLMQWIDGVFIAPLHRLTDEMGRTINPQSFSLGVLIAAVGGAAALTASWGRSAARWGSAAAVAAFVGLMFFVPNPKTYAAVWDAARLAPLVAGVGLVAYLAHRHSLKRRDAAAAPMVSPAVESTTFLFVAAAAVFALVQYPIVNGIYFLYVAPLIVAAVWFTLSVVAQHSVLPRLVWCGMVLGFTSLWVWEANSFLYGTVYMPATFDVELPSKRMPLRYDRMSVEVFNHVKRVVQENSNPDEPILALPDTPHIYFITNRPNPTRTFFDVFDDDYGTPARDRRLLKMLDEKHVQVIVERNFTSFSTEAVSPEFRREIRKRFPNRHVIADKRQRYFTIRWRDRDPASSETSSDASRETATTKRKSPAPTPMPNVAPRRDVTSPRQTSDTTSLGVAHRAEM